MSCHRPLSSNILFFFLGSRPVTANVPRLDRDHNGDACPSAVLAISACVPRLGVRRSAASVRQKPRSCTAAARRRLHYARRDPDVARRAASLAVRAESLRLGDGGSGNGTPCPYAGPSRADGCRRDFSSSPTRSPRLGEPTTIEENVTENGKRVVAYEPRAKSSAASSGQRSSPTGCVCFLSSSSP